MKINPDKWVDDYSDMLYRYAYIRVRNKAVAEDLVQETFLAAIKGQDSFAGNATERTWMTGILRNKCLDYFRKQAREAQLKAPLDENTEDPDFQEQYFNEDGSWITPPSSWGSPEKTLENDHLKERLQKCVDALPETARISFMMREFDDVDSIEIADTLNISTNNLWVLLSRARLKLQHCLQTHWLNQEF